MYLDDSDEGKYIFEGRAKPTGMTERLDMCCEENERSRITPRTWTQQTYSASLHNWKILSEEYMMRKNQEFVLDMFNHRCLLDTQVNMLPESMSLEIKMESHKSVLKQYACD